MLGQQGIFIFWEESAVQCSEDGSISSGIFFFFFFEIG